MPRLGAVRNVLDSPQARRYQAPARPAYVYLSRVTLLP